jgi:hypothetical protein
MSSIRRHWRLLGVAVCCAALGAGVSAIATAGAATSATAGTTTSGHAAAQAGKTRSKTGKASAGRLRRLARAVQGSVVVHTKNGFATVTFERGKVASVSGERLTITEGTPKAAYRTVTVTVPANAVVRDDRRKATLSDVKPGQRVLVLAAPKRTYVVARTP